MQAKLLYDLFLRQMRCAGRFKAACSICHGRARDLARNYLVISSSELRGRYTGNDIGTFLAGHGRLDATGALFYRDLLAELTAELGQVGSGGGKDRADCFTVRP